MPCGSNHTTRNNRRVKFDASPNQGAGRGFVHSEVRSAEGPGSRTPRTESVKGTPNLGFLNLVRKASKLGGSMRHPVAPHEVTFVVNSPKQIGEMVGKVGRHEEGSWNTVLSE